MDNDKSYAEALAEANLRAGTVTLREWLEEAAVKGYPIRWHMTVGAAPVPAEHAIARASAASLNSPVRLIPLNVLYRTQGRRGVIAEIPSGLRWIRIEACSDD